MSLALAGPDPHHRQGGSPGEAAPAGVLGELAPSEGHIPFRGCNKRAGDCPLASKMTCL